MARSLLAQLRREHDVPAYRVLETFELPGRYAGMLVGPRRGQRPPYTLLELHLTPSGRGGQEIPISDAPGALDAAIASAKRAWPVPRATRPAVPAPRRAPRPRVDEPTAAAPFAAYRVDGTPPRARAPELARLARKLGGLPAGYATFVSRLGEGLLATRVRVYGPARILRDLAGWRERVEDYWCWGDAPLDQATALAGARLADTVTGDELVFHPGDPDAIWLLPRSGTRARALGRGFGAAVRRLVKDPRATLTPLARPRRR